MSGLGNIVHCKLLIKFLILRKRCWCSLSTSHTPTMNRMCFSKKESHSVGILLTHLLNDRDNLIIFSGLLLICFPEGLGKSAEGCGTRTGQTQRTLSFIIRPDLVFCGPASPSNRYRTLRNLTLLSTNFIIYQQAFKYVPPQKVIFVIK